MQYTNYNLEQKVLKLKLLRNHESNVPCSNTIIYFAQASSIMLVTNQNASLKPVSYLNFHEDKDLACTECDCEFLGHYPS